MAKSILKAGQTAPEFSLQGTQGTFTLSQNLGKFVVIAFYPGDETPVCTKQMCSYSDNLDRFASLNAEVVGISGKSLASKEKFEKNSKLSVPLLADEDLKVASLYGAVTPIVPSVRRALFVISPAGEIVYSKAQAIGLTFVSADEISKIIADNS